MMRKASLVHIQKAIDRQLDHHLFRRLSGPCNIHTHHHIPLLLLLSPPPSLHLRVSTEERAVREWMRKEGSGSKSSMPMMKTGKRMMTWFCLRRKERKEREKERMRR